MSFRTAFAGKIVVIAGGASGIGRELAYQLVEAGSEVIVLNRAGNSLDAFDAEVADRSLPIKTFSVDMTQSKSVQTCLANIYDASGRVDYFFNCVGIVQGGEVRDVPLQTAEAVLHTNLNSTLYGTYWVYQKMQQQRSGHIVLVSSAAGLLPVPFMAYYTMSKMAIVGFAHALRAEAKGYGVRVSVACPGFVRTPIYAKSYYDKLPKQTIEDVLFNRLPVQDPSVAVRRMLRGIQRRRATVHTWYSLHLAWFYYRLFPNGYLWIMSQVSHLIRRKLKTSN